MKTQPLTTAIGLLAAAVSFFASAATKSPIQFVDEAVKRGVSDIAVNSTGPTFGDYDNDGDLDVFVPVEDLAPGLTDRLFENDGKGYFKDVAASRGVQNPGTFNRGAIFGDYDNDGDLDLLTANMPPGEGRRKHIPTTLFKNQLKETGSANFVDVTRASGLMRKGNEEDAKIGGIGDTAGGVAWGDYDRDGDLDVYWKNADAEIDNALFRNNGDGTFADVTAESGAGVQNFVRESNSQGSPNWTDIDQDGWLDLLVTMEGDRKVLLRNKGDGSFENITANRRPPNGLPFLNPGNAQGACIADFDHDGDMDFYLPSADQANRLVLSRFIEKKAVQFEDTTLQSGAGDKGGARGCVAADFDNDGHTDLYVNNGGLSNTLINDVIKDFPPFVQFYIAWDPAPNTLLRGRGDGTFVDITQGSGAESIGIGSGVGAADLNNDGFSDLYVTNRTYYALGKQVSPQPGQTRLLINRANKNHWIKIRLRGTKGNRDGLGSRVVVTAGDLVQTFETTSAHGYNSTNDPVLTVGLGQRTSVEKIEVRWLLGGVSLVERPTIRSEVEVVEP